VRGADAVLDFVGIDALLGQTDLVFTGEGRLDAQINYGKLTGTLAKRAHKHNIPVICVTGGVAAGYEAAYERGISAIIIAADGPRSLAETMPHVYELIASSVARALRLWHVP
jgi:glycerate 2-kinase